MKSLITLLFFLSFPMIAHAQNGGFPTPTTNTAANSMLWFQLGPAFSNLSNSDSRSDLSSRTGLFAAAEYEFGMSPMFSIQTGLDFIQKGSSRSDSVTYALNYLELPLTGKLKIAAGTGNLSLLAGPYFALALSRQAKSTNLSIDISDSFKASDFGLRFGANYELPLTDIFSLSLGGLYDLGLINIVQGAANTGSSVYNRTFAVLAGFGMKM